MSANRLRLTPIDIITLLNVYNTTHQLHSVYVFKSKDDARTFWLEYSKANPGYTRDIVNKNAYVYK